MPQGFELMAGPVTIACPSCGQVFPVPTELVHVDTDTNQVLCRLDRSAMYGHLAECAGTTDRPLDAPVDHHPAEVSKAMAESSPSKADLVGRVTMFLLGGHFIAKGGSRACTMCGVKGDECLRNLAPTLTVDGKVQSPGTPCCSVCGAGNTHTAPGEAEGTCAQWGAEHGAKS